MVAALYVEKDGAYYGLPNVDPWDAERDARTYASNERALEDIREQAALQTSGPTQDAVS